MMEASRLLHLGCGSNTDEDEYLPAKLCAVESPEETKWTGYYDQSGTHHQMDFALSLEPDGTIQGSGSDGVGAFTWTGTFEKNDVNALKKYVGKHSVTYVGQLSENMEKDRVEFDGTWTVIGSNGQPTEWTGDFSMTEMSHLLSLGCGSGTPEPTPVPTQPCVLEEVTHWTGYYEQGGSQHHMEFSFELEQGSGETGAIHGEGSNPKPNPNSAPETLTLTLMGCYPTLLTCPSMAMMGGHEPSTVC